MKKSSLILLFGLVGCLIAFAAFYRVGTASSRELLRQPQPELAWLKKEFNLDDSEYARIMALHQAYMPQCAARCRAIEEQNAKLKQLLAGNATLTPEVQAVVARRAAMRTECEAEMLKHFLEVSRTMAPEQGRRYLVWVEQQTFLRGEAMERRHHDNRSHPH